MAKDEVQLNKTGSILDEINQLHAEISCRAYEHFCGHEGPAAGPLADWFRAERELVRSPAIELRQQDGKFDLEVSLAGVDPRDLDIQIAPQDILIKGHTEHHHRHDIEHGTVHVCEFASGKLFRSIHLPESIDPDSVKVDLRHGLLRLTATIAVAKPDDDGENRPSGPQEGGRSRRAKAKRSSA